GLVNRVLMLERLNLALEKAQRNHSETALLCIDLDRFKGVNDSFGHSCGDEVLIEAATRLSGCVRHGDTLARMGGDEFIIILENTTLSDSSKTAEKIIAAFSHPFRITNKEYIVTASIGIAHFSLDGTNASIL